MQGHHYATTTNSTVADAAVIAFTGTIVVSLTVSNTYLCDLPAIVLM